MTKPTDEEGLTRWLPVLNSSGETVPAFALMRVTGVDTSSGSLIVGKPNADNQTNLLVNGPCEIPSGLQGIGMWGVPAVVCYDTGDGTPVAGDEWGAESGGWKLRNAKTGYIVSGVLGTGFVSVMHAVTTSSTDRFDWNYYHRVDLPGGDWHACAMPMNLDFDTITPDTTGAAYALPMVLPHGRNIKKLAILNTTGAVNGSSAKCRIGIYECNDGLDLASGTLIVDSGEIALNGTGFKSASVSTAIRSDRMYFAVVQFNNVANDVPVVRGCAQSSSAPFRGLWTPWGMRGSHASTGLASGWWVGMWNSGLGALAALPASMGSLTMGFLRLYDASIPMIWYDLD